MCDITEKPIHFPVPLADEMIRAILSGRKTQHRVPLKPQPGETRRCVHFDGTRWYTRDADVVGAPIDEVDWVSPFGSPGDRRWVQECWGHATNVFGLDDDWPNRPHIADDPPDEDTGRLWSCAIYRADGLFRWVDENESWERDDGHPVSYWKPSTTMPRWASRNLLEVTEVRRERVQDISEEDAIAEGFRPLPLPERRVCEEVLPARIATARERFRDLAWNSIYADKGLGWDENPWIFAATFKRIDGEEEAAPS